MPQSLSNILLHIVFSTKHRAPLIPRDTSSHLYGYLIAIATAHDCPAHNVGGTENHVHICCTLGRTVTCARFVEELKTGSSKWMKTQGPTLRQFSWQNGYGAFSIGQSQLPALNRYLEKQREHHAEISFEEELRDLLRRYNIAYDERYVWD